MSSIEELRVQLTEAGGITEAGVAVLEQMQQNLGQNISDLSQIGGEVLAQAISGANTASDASAAAREELVMLRHNINTYLDQLN